MSSFNLQNNKENQNDEEHQKQKIYIKNIGSVKSLEISEQKLKIIFAEYGKIIDFKILQNKYKKWYSFITFSKDESVQKILEKEILFEGKKLKITRAKKPIINIKNDLYLDKSKKIFIGGLPSQVTKKELLKYFQKFGEIEDICLPLKNQKLKINKGYGFITYVDSESVALVVDSLNRHFIRGKWIEIKIAKPRDNTSPNFKAYCDKSNMASDCNNSVFDLKLNEVLEDRVRFFYLKCDEEFFLLNPKLRRFSNELFLKFRFRTCSNCFKSVFDKSDFTLFRNT